MMRCLLTEKYLHVFSTRISSVYVCLDEYKQSNVLSLYVLRRESILASKIASKWWQRPLTADFSSTVWWGKPDLSIKYFRLHYIFNKRVKNHLMFLRCNTPSFILNYTGSVLSPLKAIILCQFLCQYIHLYYFFGQIW